MAPTPETPSLFEDDHGYAEWKANTARDYMGETLDIASRRRVRHAVTSKMKTEPWRSYWVGVSRADRTSLICAAADACRAYWLGRAGAAVVECWTYQAIAEEIDFYLPKVFWANYRSKKKGAKKVGAANTYVDPWSKTFSEWCFHYPETRERLAAERRFLDDAIAARDGRGGSGAPHAD